MRHQRTVRARGTQKKVFVAVSTHRGTAGQLGIGQRSKPKPCAWSIAQVLNSFRRSISPPARIGGHYRQLAERSVVLRTQSELAAFFLLATLCWHAASFANIASQTWHYVRGNAPRRRSVAQA